MLSKEEQKELRKELRTKFGVFKRFTIIQIVGLLLIASLATTLVYQLLTK
jgi:hypothetical protein